MHKHATHPRAWRRYMFALIIALQKAEKSASELRAYGELLQISCNALLSVARGKTSRCEASQQKAECGRKNKKSEAKGQKVVDKRRKVSIISKVSRGESGAERRNV